MRVADLFEGIDPKKAIDDLAAIAQDAQNKWGTYEDDMPLVYREWAGTAVVRLRLIAGLARAYEVIQTPQYWHLLSTNLDPRLVRALFQEEFNRRQLEFEGYAEEVRKRLALLAPQSTDWLTVVLDTSALLDLAVLLDDAWCPILGSQVRVVVPLRVVEELDKLKYQGRDQKVRDLARSTSRMLVNLLSNSGPRLRVETKRIFSVEVLVDPHRDRPEHADEEILQTCKDLQQYGCKALVLFASDASMRFQAEARGVPAELLREEFLQSPASTASA